MKKREPFRPYAPAVLTERASEFFDIEDSPYMLLVGNARKSETARIRSILHTDDTARLQTVRDDGSRFRKLLEKFYARTGLPMLLNTSFNLKGEPLVETPKDALDAFLRSSIEVLVIEDFFVRRGASVGSQAC